MIPFRRLGQCKIFHCIDFPRIVEQWSFSNFGDLTWCILWALFFVIISLAWFWNKIYHEYYSLASCFTNMDWLYAQHGYAITSIIKWGDITYPFANLNGETFFIDLKICVPGRAFGHESTVVIWGMILGLRPANERRRLSGLILGLGPSNERRRLSGLILGLRPANERRRYFVTTSFIGRAQA